MSDSLQIEVIRVRILILQEYFPEYSDNLEKVLLYTQSDPASALMKMRQVFEEILKNLWEKFMEGHFQTTFEIVNELSNQGVFPKRILNRIHSLRTICNLAVHGDDVNSRDVIMGVSNLSELLEWYGLQYKGIESMPEAVERSLPFKRYLVESLQSSLFLTVLMFHVAIPTALFRYHDLLSSKLNRPFLSVYEGVFDRLSFVLLYSSFLVFLTSLLSWSLFRRFRKQDFITRVISFELMFMLVFSLQYFLLNVTDYYTGLY